MDNKSPKISLRHSAVIKILKLAGGRQILAKQFENGQGSTAAPTKGQSTQYGITRTEFQGQPIWHYPGDETLIYFVHGGGYVAGFSYFYFPMMGKIAQRSGARLIAPDYPLYPHIDAAGTHSWIRAHYDQTIAELKPAKTVLMGDSAGANAVMILAQSLAQSSRPADKLVMLAPWIDLRMSHPDMVQHPEEQLLDGSKILLAAERHAGGLGLDHPLISPIFGELASLPPTWIFTGDKDLLHPDIMTSIDRLKAAGQSPTVDIAAGMPHDYMLLPTPEGRAALSRIAQAV